MLLESGVDPKNLKQRVLDAATRLGPGEGYFNSLAVPAMGHSYKTPHTELGTLISLFHHTARMFGAYDTREIGRSASGKPVLKFGSRRVIIGMTDCVGGLDAETAGRIRVVESDALESIGLGPGPLPWLSTERLSASAIRGAVTSIYLEQLQRQISEQDYHHQLVLLGNAAPRDPKNPDAKGCPFVLAILEGDVAYLGTLNRGGIELQGIRPYVKELWITTLSSENGTEGGKHPERVFRSKYLVPTLKQLIMGNEKILTDKLDVGRCIMPLRDIEVDSRDTLDNIKLTVSFGELCQQYEVTFGDYVSLTIGDATHPAKIAKSHGDGLPNEVLIVPSSSLCDLNTSRADVVVNGGRAAEVFAGEGQNFERRPWAGTKVSLKLLATLGILHQVSDGRFGSAQIPA